jgi:hypothetical protein
MAQSEVKEKRPMFSYVGNWAIPRAQCCEMEKANTGDQPTYEKAFNAGKIVGYGMLCEGVCGSIWTKSESGFLFLLRS